MLTQLAVSVCWMLSLCRERMPDQMELCCLVLGATALLISKVGKMPREPRSCRARMKLCNSASHIDCGKIANALFRSGKLPWAQSMAISLTSFFHRAQSMVISFTSLPGLSTLWRVARPIVGDSAESQSFFYVRRIESAAVEDNSFLR